MQYNKTDTMKVSFTNDTYVLNETLYYDDDRFIFALIPARVECSLFKIALFVPTLILYKGFTWNGANKAINTPSVLKASAVHDALYLLIKKGCMVKGFRKTADAVFYDICRAEGMGWFRAQYMYYAVRLFGWRHV